MVYHILSLLLALLLTGNCANITTYFSSIQSVFPDYSLSEDASTPSTDVPSTDVPSTPNTDDTPTTEDVTTDAGNTPSLVSYFASYDFSKPVPTCSEVDNSYFADAAFVGDSRTEGFWLYSKVKQGKLISYTGLTVFGALGAKVISINGGKYTVPEALSFDSYSKIYLSFGVNELGYRDTEAFYRTYCQLIDSIRTIHPNAIIYVQTLIPVNDQRAAATGHGRYVNCQRLSEFNEVIRRVANDKRVPLLDMYSAFVVDGQLPEDASRDGVHLVPEYCEKQLDFYRSHAIPTDVFANLTAPSAPQKTGPSTQPATAPVNNTTTQPPAAPVAPVAPQPSAQPAAPETPAEPTSPAEPVPPANTDPATPTAPAESANPVQPATPPAPETPTTQTKPEATEL